MTNDEIPDDEGMTNSESRQSLALAFRGERLSVFNMPASFVIGHSSMTTAISIQSGAVQLDDRAAR